MREQIQIIQVQSFEKALAKTSSFSITFSFDFFYYAINVEEGFIQQKTSSISEREGITTFSPKVLLYNGHPTT